MVSAKTYEDWERHRLIPSGRQRLRSGKLTLGESLFIMVLFHLSPFKDFKHYWIYGVEQKYRDCFGNLPSYGRFVSLMPRLMVPFCILFDKLKTSMGLEHTRHRSPANAFVHLISCVAAYRLGKTKVKMGPITVPETIRQVEYQI